MARFGLNLVVEELDPEAIEVGYGSGSGRPPFDPAMMTSLLLYAYGAGVYSSRRIAKAAGDRVDFMSVVGLDAADFRTITDFLKRRLKALAGLFTEVPRLGQRAGRLKRGQGRTGGGGESSG